MSRPLCPKPIRSELNQTIRRWLACWLESALGLRCTERGFPLARRSPLRQKNVLTYAAISQKYIAKEKRIGDPNRLVLVEEADRLKMISLEQMRPIFDAGGVGLVLIGMRGIEKRMGPLPAILFSYRICARISPTERFRNASALDQGQTPAGVSLPALDSEAVTSVIRITSGNFRLFERLLTQIERITEINKLTRVSKEVVESARESLVIGQA